MTEAEAMLQQLDSRIAEAGSLDRLLAQPLLLDAYYEQLAQYYGPHRFLRVAFDALVRQLIEIKESVPALKTLLWDTGDLGRAFSIRSEFKLYGRTVDHDRWIVYLNEWMENLRERASAVQGLSLAEWIKLQQRLPEFQEELSRFAVQVKSLPEHQGGKELGEFACRLRDRTKLDAIAARALLNFVTSMETTALFHCGNAELILEELRTLRQDPDRLGYDSARATILHASVRALIPPIHSLLVSGLFPVEYHEAEGRRVPVGRTAEAEFSFLPLPRRIHGIWKGIAHWDCFGGSPHHTAMLTPARWLSIAMPGASVHQVFEGSSYAGYVQVTPIRKGKQVYGSVEFQSPAMLRKLRTPGPREARTECLFRMWLRKASANLPRRYEGLVSGEFSFTNRYLTRMTSEMLAAGEAKLVGTTSEFAADWDLACEVIRKSPFEGLAAGFEKTLLVEGLASRASAAPTLVLRLPTVSKGAQPRPEKGL